MVPVGRERGIVEPDCRGACESRDKCERERAGLEAECPADRRIGGFRGCQILKRKQPSLAKRLWRKALRRNRRFDHVRESGARLVIINQGGTFDGIEWMEACQLVGVPYVIVSQAAAEQWWPHDDACEQIASAYEGAVHSYFVSRNNLELAQRQIGIELRHASIVSKSV